MSDDAKKPSRTATLNRLEEVAAGAVGTATPLDQAFAAFEDTNSRDPEEIAALQARLRELLAAGMTPPDNAGDG